MTPLAKPNYRALGALLMAVAIAMGAFGAHALKSLLAAKDIAVYETAIFYFLLHALALAAIPFRQGSARLLVLGMLLFSGSLILLSTRSWHHIDVAWLGPVTPLGGLCLMAAWVWHAIQLFVSKTEK